MLRLLNCKIGPIVDIYKLIVTNHKKFELLELLAQDLKM
jgi:hypothetical protein